MILITILLLLAAGYSYAFYYTQCSLWFYFLWVPLSLILSFFTYVLFVVIVFQYMKKTDPKNKFRHWLLHQTCFMILKAAHISVKVVGKEFVPKEPFVCYSNHKSDIDPIVLYYALHRICSAVGKKSLFTYPVIKQCKPVFGVISIDRENDREAAKSIIEGIKAIRKGMSYIIFPEGGIKTRQTEEMVDLRAGAYKLVTKSGALLLPATIVGSSATKRRKTILKKVKITVIFHEPISEEVYKNYTTAELGQMVMNLVHEDILNYEKNHR